MSRDIKFRGRNGQKFFYYSSWFTLDQQQTLCFDNCIKPSYVDNSDVDYPNRVILQQYTGLKDCKGKEIYEGDIVEWDDNSKGKWRRRCVISWVKSHYVLKGYWYDVNNPEKKNPIDFKFGAFIYEKDGELEIIGNIYENPDLLPKQTDG